MQTIKKEKNNKIIRKKLYYIYARKDNNNFLFEVRGGSLTFLVIKNKNSCYKKSENIIGKFIYKNVDVYKNK